MRCGLTAACCFPADGGDGGAERGQLMPGGSSPRPGPRGPQQPGPAVILLMISLFCRKSLSPGETRHFRLGGKPDAGPGRRRVPGRLQPRHQGPALPFIPPASSTIHTLIRISRPSSSGVSLYLSAVTVFF
ncbi:hypothetical protein PBY51_014532 [Eleginops maclovinus]|uniref:Uncharacterized protein n=1 Tax=Eleginops maclovinus TaxID=56733 RepID=A0AAN7WXR0_ELEMC|nr:hypothetical protein PBY51_014532 [Eleginops maclovinus]